MELAVQWTGRAGGVPVLVLHGFTGSGAAMAPLTDRLVAAGRPGAALRVITADLVGHGDSGAPEDLDLYRVEAMAGQVIAVAGALELGTFHLVGYSMGGRVALTLGCSAPHRLRSLTLIGASAGIADPAERRRRTEADEARAERLTRDFGAFVDEWMADPLFAGQAALGESHLQAARAQRLASNPAGLARSLAAGGTGAMSPVHERLVDCDVPTLLVVGTDDSKFCGIADYLAAALPTAAVALIDGAGHAAHVERPDVTAAAIAEFIAGAEARPAGDSAAMSAAVIEADFVAGVEARPAGERHRG